jgi:predicted nucleotidyltransferase
MYKHEQHILKTLTGRLRERFPERIERVYAFGSRSRGDHDQWSDFDVLVVVKDRTPALEREIIGIFVEEELKRGVPFSPVIKDSIAYYKEKELHTPFYENIQREGVAF